MSSSIQSRLPCPPVRPTPWWSDANVRAHLLALANREFSRLEPDVGGIYVHSLKYFRENFARLKALKSINKLFFAMKANPNKELIAEAIAMGSGIECVSLNELKTVLEIAPSICGTRVLFTPNFAGRAEYAAIRDVFDTSARRNETSITQVLPFVTIDNLWTMEHWPLDLFAGVPLFVRVDPGEDGHGHHSYVHTGASSKFGVTREELTQFVTETEKGRALAAHIVGLHMHKGSGLEDPSQWAKSAEMLLAAKGCFPALKYVDLGGGIGVPYKPSDAPLDLDALDAHLAEVTSKHPDITFCIEPGRFVVASSGVLIARVHQLKHKGPYRFVGVSAGMNHLIRPALYQSYHHIVNLSKYDNMFLRLARDGLDHTANVAVNAADAATTHFDSSAPLLDSLVVNVVGPICESGDFLGQNRVFPRATEEGDVVLVDTVGAYGRAMACNYNLRAPGPEFILDM